MCGLVVFCYERDRDGCYQNWMGFPAGAIQKKKPRLVKTMWWPKGVKIVIISLSMEYPLYLILSWFEDTKPGAVEETGP